MIGSEFVRPFVDFALFFVLSRPARTKQVAEKAKKITLFQMVDADRF
ncbi:MAG: hypothetical protein AAFV87_10490 [Pseudomonadota bacterium]